MEKLETLNRKIHDIVSACEGPSSLFADLVKIKRPILSHILNGRNKPSLEVIQNIVKVFPNLGLSWTFDNEILSQEQIAYVTERFEKLTQTGSLFQESSISSNSTAASGLFNSQGLPFALDSSEEIAQIFIVYKNGRFVTLNPVDPHVKS